MRRYTFSGLKPTQSDNLTTVSAPDELTARSLAMEARWGKTPQRLGCTCVHCSDKRRFSHIRSWTGRGLTLIKVT